VGILFISFAFNMVWIITKRTLEVARRSNHFGTIFDFGAEH